MRKWDELNLQEKIDYREWFDVLDVPEEDKEKRVELAEKIDDTFDWLFALISLMAATGETIDTEYLILSVQYRLEELVNVNVRYVSEHIVKVAGETVETTVEHIDEDYYLSPLRSSEIAANEAQAYYNYEELQEAYENGCTKKTWVAEVDKKTRKDHLMMNGKTIPIEDYFQFPDCEMIMPHDEVNGSGKQTVNCRCVCKFS